MTCVRSKLVAHANGELSPLEQQLVDAHIARCSACRAVLDDLERGLHAAKQEVPVDAEMLVALMHDVPHWSQPVVDLRARRRRIAVASIGSVATIAAAAVLAFTHSQPIDATSTATNAPTHTTQTVARAEPVVAPTTPATPAALEIEPVEKPKSIAHASVAHLKRIETPRAPSTHAEPTFAPVPNAAEQAAIAGEEPEEGTLEELLPQLDECERLGRAGDADEALARYRALEENPRFAAHADLVAYNRARLEGLVLGDVDAALPALTKLARDGHGHIAAEAALTRCEVERKTDACAALACLDNIHGDAAVDAQRLRDRWRSSCGVR